MKDNNLVQMSEIKREEINKRCIIFKKLIEKSAELVHLNLCVHEGKIGFVDQERWRIVAVWEPMYHRPSDDENDAEEYEKVLEQWKDSVALAEQVKRVGVQKLSEILAAEADGRCVVLPTKEHADEDGEKALKHAMLVLGVVNNGANRYTVDAILEKLTREASGKATEEMEGD